MLFKDHHIEQIRNGEKTETRRVWETPQVKEGNTYRATTNLFTPREEADAYITVTNVKKEQIGEITEAAAQREGEYSLEEFKQVWIDIHGVWEPTQEVWVVRFDGHKEDPLN